MRGQIVQFTTETRDCCEGLEPQGLTCGGCGRHFHVGTQLLQEDDDRLLECPSCGAGCLISDIDGERKEPAHTAIVDILCGEVSAEVGDRIRNIAKTRKTADPNYWSNVMLREQWWAEHGNYGGWDRAAIDAGQDPSIYEPASS